MDNPKRRGKAPPFWSLGVQGRDRNAPAVLLGDQKGGFSHVRESPPFTAPLRGAGNYPAALRAALFFIRFGITRQRIEIQIQRHQLAEAREDFVFELRREQHAFGIVVIADGDIFRVVPRVQELADVALRALELLAGCLLYTSDAADE